MRINNNLMAMNTHRQLGTANTDSAKSIEKLSSGYRINRAGDDAAGLAISEKMRGQIRGLNQASANSQDGISMIQTAEGALTETHAILQRMRELAVQSGNDTNVGVDRSEIQKEMDQLTTEINRIGNTTEFNTQSILKGDGKANISNSNVVDGSVKVGGTTAGVDAFTTQVKRTDAVTTGAVTGENISYTINGQTLDLKFLTEVGVDATKAAVNESSVTSSSATIGIGTGTLGTADQAAAMAEGLQAMIDKNEVLKGNYKATVTGSSVVIEAVEGGEFEGSKGTISAATGTGTTGTGEITNTSGSTNLGSHTAAVKASTDVSLAGFATDVSIEELVGKGMTINGQQVEFYNANDGAYTGNAIGVNISDALAATADKAQALAKTIADQLGSKLDGVVVSSAAAGNDLVITAKEGGVAGNKLEVKDGGVQESFTANFQVGANQGQSMAIEIKDMRAGALGLTGKAGAEGFVANNSVTNGMNNNGVEAALDVSTHEKAAKSITVINDAIEKVSAQRSSLGAFQNRLEHTIKNLDTSSENLQAAESRIRDVDMAKEMMEQTKNNILAQASTAMLAQANQAPQAVLQLLR